MLHYKFLITGSRDANAFLISMAGLAVYHAKRDGWTVIVGDNPDGVDAEVVRSCELFSVPYVVYGIKSSPRLTVMQHGSYKRVNASGVGRAAWTERDRRMIDDCDRLLAIWNGKSSGTKAGYDYAVSIDKKAELFTEYECEQAIQNMMIQYIYGVPAEVWYAS